MRTVALLAVALGAWGQIPAPVEYRYLYTFGSKDGIHPPKVLNKKPASIVFGAADHPYGIAFPEAAAADTRHRVWITDSATNSVHVFDPVSGAYREISKIAGVPLQRPTGIAADGVGRIYISDTASGGLFEIDDNGESERSVLPKNAPRVLQAPTSIAVSSDHRTLFVLDPPRHAVVAFNLEGEVLRTIGSAEELPEPVSLSAGNNQIYILDNTRRRVIVYTSFGIHRNDLYWPEIPFPMAFAYDAAHARYAVANPRFAAIQVFNAAGQNVGAFGQLGNHVDQFTRVDGLFIDAEGGVYVVDSHAGKVIVFQVT